MNLPFDANAMLEGLRTWVECESPTYDPAAVNRMMDLVTRDLIVAGAPTLDPDTTPPPEHASQTSTPPSPSYAQSTGRAAATGTGAR